MPLLIITPEEISEKLDKVPNIPDIIKDYSIKENSFRVDLKIDKIPMDIRINLKYDSYSHGMFLFTYSGNIPKIFLNLLRNVIRDRTDGVITISEDFIKMNADNLISKYRLAVVINNVIFEHGFYKIDFSI